MPRTAVAGGFVDFVLPPEQIASELVRIAKQEYMTGGPPARLPDQELMKLFTVIQSSHDIDFRHYKPSTIERRIRRRMVLPRVDSLGRPINDLKALRLDHLNELIGEVIEKLEVKEVEIRDRKGHPYSLRIRPYKTTDNKIDGAVLVLIDLEEFRRRGSART